MIGYRRNGLAVVVFLFFVMLLAGRNLTAGDRDPNGQSVSSYPAEPNDANAPSYAKDANEPNCLPYPTDPNDPNYPKDPNELLRMNWDAVIWVLKRNDVNNEETERRISKILRPVFDFPLMAKLALGRKHWPEFTPVQRQEFTRLFVGRLETAYWENIKLYTNEEAVFKPPVRKKKTLWIPMVLLSEAEEVAILYKLRKAKERWKVYDVEIQGVSIVLTYRSQFDDILQKGTAEELLSRLAEKGPR